MAMSGNVKDREMQKFVQSPTRTNGSAVEVLPISYQIPADYDNGTVSYPTSTQEVYRFYSGVTLLKTLTINYTSASKNDVSSWSWS